MNNQIVVQLYSYYYNNYDDTKSIIIINFKMKISKNFGNSRRDCERNSLEKIVLIFLNIIILLPYVFFLLCGPVYPSQQNKIPNVRMT